MTVLPGPSAVETALVASGLVGERYQFVGYLPRSEKARSALWDELARWPFPVVAFESPRRLPASLASLAAASPERPVAVCRELSKRFEEVVRGTAAELAERFLEPPRGEITLVIGAYEAERGDRRRRASRGCRARRGRSRAPAGCGRGRPAYRPVPERALPPVFVARFDNSRAALYSGRMVFKIGNNIVLALLVLLVLAPSASAWAWPVDGPVLRPFVGGRSVRGRPASRHRHRRPIRVGRALRGERDRVVRRAIAASGPVPDRPHRGWLLGHARPSRIDRCDHGHAGLRGRHRRHDRADRRRRRHRAVRVSRHPAHCRPERIPRPAHASSAPRAAAAVSGLPATRARSGAAARSSSGAGDLAAVCSQAVEHRVSEAPCESSGAAADIRADHTRAACAVARAAQSRSRRAPERWSRPCGVRLAPFRTCVPHRRRLRCTRSVTLRHPSLLRVRSGSARLLDQRRPRSGSRRRVDRGAWC